MLVVGETPSLGRSIRDLLESGGLRAHYVDDVRAEQPLGTLAQRFPVVVAACNAPYCSTARRWASGEFPHVELVVVGARDPQLLRERRLHLVELPLLPGRLLGLVQRLIDGAAKPPAASSGGF